MATITPKASEVTISFRFFGPDAGTFPETTTNTAITTRKLNRLRLETGDQTADFKAGQTLVGLERIIGSSPRIAGHMNLEHPDAFVKKFRDEGPLVQLTVSVLNYTLEGEAQEERFVFNGLMKGPEIDFLNNPGAVTFEVVPYGSPILFFASSEDKP